MDNEHDQYYRKIRTILQIDSDRGVSRRAKRR